MFSEINAKLVEIQGQMRKAIKYKAQLADYEQELETIELEHSRLYIQFEAEEKDVTKLESISLTNLLATLSGSKDVKLIKEKQELAAAQNKLIAAEQTKNKIAEEIHLLRQKTRSLENLEKDYQQLLLQKENMIKSSSSIDATKVFELSEQEGALKAYLTELNEAIQAGYIVRSNFADAKRFFEKAEGWGLWDMFGGGMISTMVKHDRIREAEDHLRRAQASLSQFQKELLDVQQQAQVEIEISGFEKFADFFFDGLIFDYIVQDKIKRALYKTESNYNMVVRILEKLNKQYGENMQKLVEIQREKQEMVERVL